MLKILFNVSKAFADIFLGLCLAKGLTINFVKIVETTYLKRCFMKLASKQTSKTLYANMYFNSKKYIFFILTLYH